MSARRAECSLCLERFSDPRILPCFHTFCLRCLDRLIESQRSPARTPLRCPECRKNIAVPPGGARGFQANFYLDDEAESDDGDDDKEEEEDAEYDACGVHRGQKLRFYCTRCDESVCRDCKLTSHERHVTTDIKTEADDFGSTIQEIEAICKDSVIPRMYQAKFDTEESLEKLKANRHEMKDKIRKRGEKAKSIIDNYMQKSISELNKKANKEEKSVKTTLTAMEEKLNELSSFLENLEHMKTETNRSLLLKFRRHVQEAFTGEQHNEETAVTRHPRDSSTSATARESSLKATLSGPDPFSLPKLKIFGSRPQTPEFQLTGGDGTEAAESGSSAGATDGTAPSPAFLRFQDSVRQFIGEVESFRREASELEYQEEVGSELEPRGRKKVVSKGHRSHGLSFVGHPPAPSLNHAEPRVSGLDTLDPSALTGLGLNHQDHPARGLNLQDPSGRGLNHHDPTARDFSSQIRGRVTRAAAFDRSGQAGQVSYPLMPGETGGHQWRHSSS